MIFCNNCGSGVEDGMQFCTDCGSQVTMVFHVGSSGAAVAPAVSPRPLEHVLSEPEIDIVAPGIKTTAYKQSNTKILIGVISGVAVVAIFLAIYFALEASPSSRMARALRNAVENGRLVMLTNDDGYTYFNDLKRIDPSHKALKEIAPKVLPKLRSIGEETIQKKTQVLAVKDTDDDWMKSLRAYEWAYYLDPSDKYIESRWRFAEGELAKRQNRKFDAERGFTTASQLSPSWALPQNSIGLLRMEDKKYSEAITYFPKAVDIQKDWEIPYSNIGTCYFYLKEYDAALGWHQTAVQMNPQWARPHYWMGSSYEAKKMFADSVNEYEMALRLAQDNLPVNSDIVRKRVEKLRTLIR